MVRLNQMSVPPMPPPIVPRKLQRDGDALVIEWSDGATHRLRWGRLRELCPCAVCCARRAEASKAPAVLPVLRPEEAQPVEPISVKPVGNYAYAIAFNDGHSSGIYTFEYLHRLGSEGAKGR